MKKSILTILISLFVFTGCATWKGVKKDSSDAWEYTKETSEEVYDNTKRAIDETFNDDKE